MKTKLVSVLIPVYNVEQYVETAIKSIIDQTYTNLEIIVIDDGSTDNTYQIVDEIAKSDARIKLFRNEQNLKIVKTLNRALSYATGEYIARMDGDDFSMSDRIEKKVGFLENNLQYDLVGSSVTGIDKEGTILNKTTHYANEELLFKSIKYTTPISHIWVARKQLYDQLNGYRDIPGCEDYDFLLRMTTLGFRYTNLEEYFGYHVRLGRDGNTISDLGLKLRKMHNYVFKLYLERSKKGCDSFSNKNLLSATYTSDFFERLHALSSQYLHKAIIARSYRRKSGCLVFMLCSLISPYQIQYLFQRTRYRLLVKSYTK